MKQSYLKLLIALLLIVALSGCQTSRNTTEEVITLPENHELQVFWVSGQKALAQEHKLTPNIETVLYESSNLKEYKAVSSMQGSTGYFYVSPKNKKGLFYISSDAAGQQGVWKSKDGGKTWRKVFKEPVEFLAFDPTKSSTLLLVKNDDEMGAQIFFSEDEGETWLRSAVLEEAFAVNQIAINPKDPQKMLAVAHNGIWSTGDNGQHWSNIFTKSRPFGAAYNPGNSSEAYIAAMDGIYKITGNNVSKVSTSEDCKIGSPSNLVFRPTTSTAYFLNNEETTGVCELEDSNAKTIVTFGQSAGLVDLLFDSGNSEILYAISYKQLTKIDLSR